MIAASVELPPATVPDGFADKLPLRLRAGRLLALEAEDHYLRVHTDAGSDLILLRLVDAVAETDGLDGARCHRSWWVARAAVTAVERDGARTLLGIGPALRVPVSRSYLPELRAAGWLD
jgi:DNA-binding LytR/AlgR family response regulator